MSDSNATPDPQQPEAAAPHQAPAPQPQPVQPPQPAQVPPAPQASAAPQTVPAQAAAGQAAAPAVAPESKRRESSQKLSTFLKVSIVLLAGLTIASISLLFIGDFEGKFERVFSTFALFAVFVLFTVLDTRRGQKSEWYAPVALIANAYILGLLLILIWMTPYTSFGLMFEIFWKSVFVILVTRLVIICCQLLLKTGTNLPEAVTRFAFVTSMLAVLAGILFTAPVGVELFDLVIPDMYWKIATAILILTALGLSITLLLRWSYGAQDRDAARLARASQPQPAPYVAHAPQAAPHHVAPYNTAPQGTAPQGAPYPAPQPNTLPWPRFADGRPLPARPDGQPDFSVPGAPRQ